MARHTVLDAMIKRADFAIQAEGAKVDLIEKMSVREFLTGGSFEKLLRKPDFQRETNQWKPEQVATLVSSFANNELIPSLILWKSESLIFAIDGAHRLSALRAWILDDYGDGTISHSYFGGNIPTGQKKIAERTRKLVNERVGSFNAVQQWGELPENDPKFAQYSSILSRTIPIQWIQGSQDVAEASFFKINSQGTPLDKTEALLLKYRNTSYAIAARSIVRAGSGHKYWSRFTDEVQKQIEEIALQINTLLFQPYTESPIKTLDLPLGGTSSPIDALKVLLDIFAIRDGHSSTLSGVKKQAQSEDGAEVVDDDGLMTLTVLRKLLMLSQVMTGNSPRSLGLHPAVYFYDQKGKHSRFLFLGIVRLLSNVIRNNNHQFYKKFTRNRAKLEEVLVFKKAEIMFALANVSSATRDKKIEKLIKSLINSISKGEEITDALIVQHLDMTGKVSILSAISTASRVTNETKSTVYIKESLSNALKCRICGGYLEPRKSVSYDHITRVSEGGSGDPGNIQLSHPYCNTGFKN